MTPNILTPETIQELQDVIAKKQDTSYMRYTESKDGNTCVVRHYISTYVFALNNSEWEIQGILRSLSFPTVTFADSIAISHDGNTIVIGTPHASLVHIFSRKNGVWAQQAEVFSPTIEILQQFGWDVGLSDNGEWLIVTSNLGSITRCMAHIFKHVDGCWKYQSKLAVERQFHDNIVCKPTISDDGQNISIQGIANPQERKFVLSVSRGYLYLETREDQIREQISKLQAELWTLLSAK